MNGIIFLYDFDLGQRCSPDLLFLGGFLEYCGFFRRPPFFLLTVLDQHFLPASMNIQEAVLGSPSASSRVNGVQVNRGPPGVDTLLLQTLPPGQEI